MQEKDLISVIIPVHNGEKHIPKTMPRLLRQSYQNLEIIIVLNNCTDRSKEMCLALAAQDSRIRVVEDNVVGLLLVRKRGVLESHGDYICWIDVDDYYATNRAIEKMHDAIVEDGAQVVQFGHYVQYGFYRTKAEITKEKNILSRQDVLNLEALGTSGKLGGE